MSKLNWDDVENMLDAVKKVAPELKRFKIDMADGRCGNIAALVRRDKFSVSVMSDFMSPTEMNQFLRGYMFKTENRYNQTTE